MLVACHQGAATTRQYVSLLQELLKTNPRKVFGLLQQQTKEGWTLGMFVVWHQAQAGGSCIKDYLQLLMALKNAGVAKDDLRQLCALTANNSAANAFYKMLVEKGCTAESQEVRAELELMHSDEFNLYLYIKHKVPASQPAGQASYIVTDILTNLRALAKYAKYAQEIKQHATKTIKENLFSLTSQQATTLKDTIITESQDTPQLGPL